MTNHDQPPALVVNGDVATLMVPGDDYALDFRGVSLSKYGSLYAEVTARHGETALHTARFDLLNQREQESFHQRCVSVNSSVADWQSRLQVALPGLRELAAQQPTQDDARAAVNLTAAVLSFSDLLTIELPRRAQYLPWLPERGLAMVYGPRGVGKTQFTLGLATHLVTGQSYLGWPVSQPVGVLYIDGEMPLDELRQRAVLLADQQAPTSLYFLAGEMVYTKLERDLVLTQEAMRHAVGAILEAHPEIRVVILDNISCLFSGISEDSKQDWEPINAWLVRLRHRGLSVILVHHAGKAGQQRGTSGREDVLDTVIALSWPPNYEPREGCHFHLHFTKTRSAQGDAVVALDVRLEALEAHGLTWTVTTIEQSRKQQILRLLAEGDMSIADIAKELDVSPSYIHRMKREAGQR